VYARQLAVIQAKSNPCLKMLPHQAVGAWPRYRGAIVRILRTPLLRKPVKQHAVRQAYIQTLFLIQICGGRAEGLTLLTRNWQLIMTKLGCPCPGGRRCVPLQKDADAGLGRGGGMTAERAPLFEGLPYAQIRRAIKVGRLCQRLWPLGVQHTCPIIKAN
jgi:hypothetical protein